MQEIKAPEELQYQVVYTKPTITIDHFEELKAQIQAYAEKYSNLVVTPETVADAKAVKAHLNKLITELDDRRKAIKKDYNAPLKDFEDRVRELTGAVHEVVDPINQAVRDLEESQKAERMQVVQAAVAEMAPSYSLTMDDIEIKESWANATAFTKAGKPSLKTVKEIGDALKYEQTKRGRVAADQAATEAYAKSNGLDPAGWVAQVTEDVTFGQLRVSIDDELMRRKKAAEEAQHQAEADAAIAKATQKQVGDKTIDTTTGEVVSKPQVLTRGMKVTATMDQLWALAGYMDQQGIKYESINLEEEA